MTREQLYQWYVVEGRGTTQIAKLVQRDPSRVEDWLRDFGIPSRPKYAGNIPTPQPFHDVAWLEREYAVRGRTFADIAEACGVAVATVHR